MFSTSSLSPMCHPLSLFLIFHVRVAPHTEVLFWNLCVFTTKRRGRTIIIRLFPAPRPSDSQSPSIHDHLVRHSERLFLIFQLREERQRRSAEECRSHSSMWGTHSFLHLLGVSLGNTDSGGPTCEPWKPPCGRLLRGQPQTHPVMNGGAPEFPKIPCAPLG